MNIEDYLQLKIEEFPDIESFKRHVESVLKDRNERLVDRSSRQFSGDGAVLLPLVYSSSSTLEDVYLLLEKRSQNLRSNPGDMAFPGGKCDKTDTDLVQTALREAAEEIGVIPSEVKPVGYLDEFVSSSRFVIRTVVGWIEENPPNGDLPGYLTQKYRPMTEESEHVVAVPILHLIDPRNYSSTPYLLDDPNRRRNGYIRYFNIDPFLKNTHIWGLTASIIRRFLDEIFPDNLLPEEK